MAKKKFNSDVHLEKLFNAENGIPDEVAEMAHNNHNADIANNTSATNNGPNMPSMEDKINAIYSYLTNNATIKPNESNERDAQHDRFYIGKEKSRITLVLKADVREYLEAEAWKLKKSLTRFINEDLVETYKSTKGVSWTDDIKD